MGVGAGVGVGVGVGVCVGVCSGVCSCVCVMQTGGVSWLAYRHLLMTLFGGYGGRERGGVVL